MDLDVVLLSRLQFALVVTFHIIFPSFTIGIAAWLATIEGMRLATGNPIYRRVFDLWLKIFAVSFGMGVVTGIVMAFQFGTNWSAMAEKMGPIQGPLLAYESFTAFILEATFLGVMLIGRDRVPPLFYWFACCMVALGTMASSFWILCNNSWMQVPLGHQFVDGKLIPADWWAITTGPIVRLRWPHMLLGAFLTTGMSVIATGAWYRLRDVHRAESRVMLHWGLAMVAVLIPIQLFIGHLTGIYVHNYQPAKFAAIEARWKTQQPASEVFLAIPDPAAQRNLLPLEVPYLGSFIASGTWDSRQVGLEVLPRTGSPAGDHPIFRVPHHGRNGRDHAGDFLVRLVPVVAPQPGGHPLVPMDRLPRVPLRLCRGHFRLVHCRGGPPALDRLRTDADQGRDQPILDR